MAHFAAEGLGRILRWTATGAKSGKQTPASEFRGRAQQAPRGSPFANRKTWATLPRGGGGLPGQDQSLSEPIFDNHEFFLSAGDCHIVHAAFLVMAKI